MPSGSTAVEGSAGSGAGAGEKETREGWTEQGTEALVLAVPCAGIGAVLGENVAAASKPEAEAVAVVAIAAAAA